MVNIQILLSCCTELHTREWQRVGAGLHRDQYAFDMQMSASRRHGERRASSGKAEQVLSRRCTGAVVTSGTSRYGVVYMHTPTILWRFDADIYVIMTSGLVSWDHLDLDEVLGEYTDDNEDRIGADLDSCTSEEEPQDEPHEKGARKEQDAQRSKRKAPHEKRRPKCIYVCPDCGREYQSVSGFRGHMVKKHSRSDLKGVSESSVYFDFFPIWGGWINIKMPSYQ